MVSRAGGITLLSKGSISVRFRKISISLFTVAFVIIAAVMFFAFDRVTNQISSAYATRYATSSAKALSAHIQKEIGLMSIAANSNFVIEWLSDEHDEAKKEQAFEVFTNIVNELYSYNMYIGLEDSHNEYRVELGSDIKNVQPVAELDPYEREDKWYFETLETDKKYLLKVDIDHFMQRKRVWLNYRVEQEGLPLGVICTGLEFSHIVGEVFSQYENSNMRGLIVDKDGIIHMDSSLIEDREFIYDDYKVPVREVFSDPDIINAIEGHLNKETGYWDEVSEPIVLNITSGQHRYMTLSPIAYTDWSFVILSGTTTIFDATYLMPIMIIIFILLIAFAVIISTVSYRLLFKPLHNLDDSLARLNEQNADYIFGVERDDELGHLSNTISDLFNKANVDALTGLYNRRFMDSSMERIMGLLSRSEGQLSVLMLDIDFFKRFNDTYGHEQGDKCLQAVAHALSYTVSRVNDIVVRYGGEEFAIVLPNTDSEGSKMFAERLLSNVRNLKIPHEKNDCAACVTISIGVTTGKVNYKQDLDMYLRKADEALYMSKNTGRDKYTYLDFTA